MLNFIKKYIQTFDKHICFTRTCALTFNSLLAIVPLFIILFEIVKRLPWFTNAYLSWQQQLLTHLSPESGKHITDILNNLIQRHHHLPIITLIFLIITSGLMIRSVEESLNDIFEVTTTQDEFWSSISYSSSSYYQYDEGNDGSEEESWKEVNSC